jgi:hypothetical protein
MFVDGGGLNGAWLWGGTVGRTPWLFSCSIFDFGFWVSEKNGAKHAHTTNWRALVEEVVPTPHQL